MSAGQTIHMKCQLIFLKKIGKKIVVASAVVVFGTFRVNNTSQKTTVVILQLFFVTNGWKGSVLFFISVFCNFYFIF